MVFSFSPVFANIRFSWLHLRQKTFFPGEELPVNERQIVHTNNGSLVLRKVLQSDAGIYNCTVTALNHRFNPNNMMNRDGTTFHSRNKNSGSKRTKNKSKVFQFETNGLKSASSSMRIKVIGKKVLFILFLHFVTSMHFF